MTDAADAGHGRGHGHGHGHDHGHGPDHGHGEGRSPVHPDMDWDEHYASEERMWSGNPNQALVAELAGTTPGRVLDVGCGEGADAIWLAQQGWAVTALDVSSVALDRARSTAADAGVEVTWVHAGLEDADLDDEGFDLVSAFYPALRKDLADDPLEALLAAVAPGGTLLFVHHADVDWTEARQRGFDPDAYLLVDDVAAGIPDGWTVELHEQRDRQVTGGGGAGHSVDTVLRARRPA